MSAAAPAVRHGIRLALALGLLQTLGTLTVDVYLPAFPRIAADFGAPTTAIQLTMTGALVGMVIGQLVVGPWSDAIGRRRLLGAAIGVHVVASLLCAASPNVAVLIATRFLQGAASAAIGVLALAMVRDLYRGRPMVRMFAALAVVSGLAIAVGPMLGSLLLRVLDWHGVFVALACYGLFVGVYGMLSTGETLVAASNPASRRPARFRAVLGDRVSVGLFLTGGLLWAGMFCYLSSSSFLFQDVFGLTEFQYGLVFASHALTMLVGTQVGARLAQRVPPGRVIGVSTAVTALAALALVAVATSPEPPLLTVLGPLWVFTFALGATTPCLQGLAMERNGLNAGTAAALLGAAQLGLGAVASPLAGFFGLGTALPLGIVVASCQLLAVCALWMVARPRSIVFSPNRIRRPAAIRSRADPQPQRSAAAAIRSRSDLQPCWGRMAEGVPRRGVPGWGAARRRSAGVRSGAGVHSGAGGRETGEEALLGTIERQPEGADRHGLVAEDRAHDARGEQRLFVDAFANWVGDRIPGRRHSAADHEQLGVHRDDDRRETHGEIFCEVVDAVLGFSVTGGGRREDALDRLAGIGFRLVGELQEPVVGRRPLQATPEPDLGRRSVMPAVRATVDEQRCADATAGVQVHDIPRILRRPQPVFGERRHRDVVGGPARKPEPFADVRAEILTFPAGDDRTVCDDPVDADDSRCRDHGVVDALASGRHMLQRFLDHRVERTETPFRGPSRVELVARAGRDLPFEVADQGDRLVGSDVDAEHMACVRSELVGLGWAADHLSGSGGLVFDQGDPLGRHQIVDGLFGGGAGDLRGGREFSDGAGASLVKHAKDRLQVEPTQDGGITACAKSARCHVHSLDLMRKRLMKGSSLKNASTHGPFALEFGSAWGRAVHQGEGSRVLDWKEWASLACPCPCR
nr:multidrug effflux MFS transporter [Leifsonia poae]